MFESILKKQLEEEEKLNKLDDELSNITDEYKQLVKAIPFEEILENNKIPFYENKDENFNEIAKIKTTEPSKFFKVIQDFNKYPEFAKINDILKKRDEIKYKYFKQLSSYILLINQDRKTLFSEKYMSKMRKLADLGYILYFYTMPDEVLKNTLDENLEKYITEIYSQNNFQTLKLNFSEILDTKIFDSELQKDKIGDLKEAISCLENYSYNSCARTLFALIDNEYMKMSETNEKTKRNTRTNQINKFIEKLNMQYYDEWWDKIKAFYELCNVNTYIQNKENINRHDLAHGVYNKIATKEDCIKLILLFINMKYLRYVLNNINLLFEEMTNDLKLANFLIKELK